MFILKYCPEPEIAMEHAITVRDAAYSQPPPVAECNQPFPLFIAAAPKSIGTVKAEAKRVCIPSTRAKPPTSSPNITKYATIGGKPILEK